jgi:hypothetical protein
MASRLSAFWAELKRRKVYRVAVVYVAVGAGVIGLAEAALPSSTWDQLQIPISVAILLGFPIAQVLAWAYEVRPEEPSSGRGPEPSPGSVRPPETPERSTGASAETHSRAENLEFGKPKVPRPSIVVLPFDDFSPHRV